MVTRPKAYIPKSTAWIIPIIAFIVLGPLFILFYTRARGVLVSNYISAQVEQNVFCQTSRRPDTNGCWNVDKKVTWVDYYDNKVEMTAQNTNHLAKEIQSKVKYVEGSMWLVVFTLIFGKGIFKSIRARIK